MRLFALALLGGCQPNAQSRPDICHDQAPEQGDVYVGEIDCGTMRIDGGDGRNADYWMANTVFRAILRNPQDAQTLLGIGGGTVVDAAPWGSNDRLHEIVPLVDGGWLDIVDFEVDGNRIRMAGTVVSLPDRVADALGEWREVAWRIEPDSPWLHMEGADGLWIHGAGGGSILDGQWVAGDIVYGHDGELLEDLGGAIRIQGATGLLISKREDAWNALGGSDTLEGTAVGAGDIEVFREGRMVARLPVDADDHFESTVPTGADSCRAVAPGRAPSETGPIGSGLDLVLGGAGSIAVTQTPAQTVAASWTDNHGRGGWRLIGPEGATLAVGAGVYELTLSGGPTLEPRTTRVEVHENETVDLGARLDQRFDPGDRVLAAMSWHGDRSYTWRGTSSGAAQRAVGQGIGYLVFTPENEVADADDGVGGFPTIPTRNGSKTTGPNWNLWTWTWAGNSKRSAHGAIDITGLTPAEALSAAMGGPLKKRLSVVDLRVLDELGAPYSADPAPTFVALEHPGTNGPIDSEWAPWFTWLDAGMLLNPVGPRTWVDVIDRDLYGWVDVEAGLIPGHVVASTGALLTLDIDGYVPGDVVSDDDRQPGWTVAVELLGAEDLDQLALIGQGGTVIRSWPGATDAEEFLLLDDYRWVAAMAWSTTTDDFAVTGPVWINAPN